MNAVPRPWLLTLAALSALATLSTNILLPSLPVIAQSLGVDEARLTAGVLGLFLAVFALAQLIVSPLSDRIGRRPVVLGGLTLFVTGSLVGAFAGTLSLLLASRVLQALGVAAASVLAAGLIGFAASGCIFLFGMGLVSPTGRRWR